MDKQIVEMRKKTTFNFKKYFYKNYNNFDFK